MKTTKNTTWKQRLSSNSNLKNEIKSIFRFAKKYHYSHDTILEHLKTRIYDKPKYTTLPNYMQSSLNGYIDANLDLMYECIEWVHWYNNEFVGKDLVFDKNFKQDLVTKSEHVYIGTQDIY